MPPGASRRRAGSGDCRHPNPTRRGGKAAVTSLLKYLAHHPSTARYLARKLAVRFVTDTPSDDLVERRVRQRAPRVALAERIAHVDRQRWLVVDVRQSHDLGLERVRATSYRRVGTAPGPSG